MTKLEIKPLTLEDVPLVANYLKELSIEDCQRMGINRNAIPSLESITLAYEKELNLPREKQTFYSFLWLVDSEAIGYSTLKDICFGRSGSLHLHMWSSKHRGKGYGPVLFSQTVLALFERFALAGMICEPKADNPMPNRMLAKVGFELIGNRTGASSELSLECKLHRYQLSKEVASNYLKAHS